jgi:hypothetical protein
MSNERQSMKSVADYQAQAQAQAPARQAPARDVAAEFDAFKAQVTSQFE